MKVTPAQQKLIDRAHKRDFDIEGFSGPYNLRSFDRLEQLSAKYEKAFTGATRLHGSADFRVAYALKEKGIGRIASCQIVDGFWFVAEK